MTLVCAMTSDGRIEERIREWTPAVRASVLEYLLMAQGNNGRDLNQSTTSRDFLKADDLSLDSHARNSISDLQSLRHSEQQLSSPNKGYHAQSQISSYNNISAMSQQGETMAQLIPLNQLIPEFMISALAKIVDKME